MTLQNHYKMARLMHRELAQNHVPVRKLVFVWGNLAPDLLFSFLYRPHVRGCAASHVENLLARMYAGEMPAHSLRFSFYLGILSHYICDFFCYPHTPAFQGTLRQHLQYEHRQTANAADMLPFCRQKSTNLSLADLRRTLGGYMEKHEALLARNAHMAYTDIPVAMHVAMWTAAAAYWHVKNTVPNKHSAQKIVASVPVSPASDMGG